MRGLQPATAIIAACLPGRALAHASEQGFVLLLPTGLYIAGGVASVALTVLLISALPGRVAAGLFRPVKLVRSGGMHPARLFQPLGFLIFVALVALGLTGPHDPSRNLLPLSVWTGFWVVLPLLHALLGNLWNGLNPWAWPARLCRAAGLTPRLRLPGAVAHWIALASFLGFAAVLLAHPAPTDPDTLAAMALCYWAFHMGGALIFGPRWLRRAEGFGILFAAYAGLAPVGRAGGRWRLGLPGWKLARTRRQPTAGFAAFMVAMLAVGSFDGFNETFLWLSLLGINPLEFPGRSAVVWPTLAGLALVVPALAAAFAATAALGIRLAGARISTGEAFRALAPALLPIALGYHLGHYLPSLLVDGQYLALALNDPLAQGADLLGLGHAHVTTGFFNALGPVRVIWLAQAGAVVLGHVLAILLAHALALRLLGSQRGATLSQVPPALFMVAYTLFGLWLLAAPRGL